MSARNKQEKQPIGQHTYKTKGEITKKLNEIQKVS